MPTRAASSDGLHPDSGSEAVCHESSTQGPRGRFAPSPTGDLHLGSLTTALASWLDIRQRGGQWWLRIDDIDPPREVPGAARRILDALAQHGLEHDGDVVWQSQRGAQYAGAVDRLLAQGDAFYCSLSRRELETLGGRHPGPPVAVQAGPDHAIRLAVPDHPITFQDRLQGPQRLNLAEADGAFVIRRRDGLFAYQLACALDDAEMGVTEVLRGADLLDSTFRQLQVIDRLGLQAPTYGHLPVVVDKDGNKLSKSAGAARLSPEPATNLVTALQLLGAETPADLHRSPVQTILDWGLSHWQADHLSGRRILPML